MSSDAEPRVILMLITKLRDANVRIHSLEQEVTLQKTLNGILKDGIKKQGRARPNAEGEHLLPDESTDQSRHSRKRHRSDQESSLPSSDAMGTEVRPVAGPVPAAPALDVSQELGLLPPEKRRKIEDALRKGSEADHFVPVNADGSNAVHGPQLLVPKAEPVPPAPQPAPIEPLPAGSAPVEPKAEAARHQTSSLMSTSSDEVNPSLAKPHPNSTLQKEWIEVRGKLLSHPRFVPKDECRVLEVKMKITPPKQKLAEFLALHHIPALCKRMDDGTDLIQFKSEQDAKKAYSVFEEEKRRAETIVNEVKFCHGVPNRSLIALAAVKVSFEAYCKFDFRFTEDDIPAVKALIERYFAVKYISLYHGETFYVTLRREKKAESCCLQFDGTYIGPFRVRCLGIHSKEMARVQL